VTSCSPVEIHWSFGGNKQAVPIHGVEGKAIKKQAMSFLLRAGLLFGLFFDPEDGASMFLPNIYEILSDCTEL
jgi:hypothetical protein